MERFSGGGTNLSWMAAIESRNEYDYYLLLNDDVQVVNTLFQEFICVDDYVNKKYGYTGLIAGAVCDYNGNYLYGALTWKGREIKDLTKIQPFEFCNANILFVSSLTVNKIGVLPKECRHQAGDFCYSYTAFKKAMPCFLMRGYMGVDELANHDSDKVKFTFENMFDMSLKERIRYLYNPIGLDFRAQIKYTSVFTPYRVPLVWFAAWIKVSCPRLMSFINKKRGVSPSDHSSK